MIIRPKTISTYERYKAGDVIEVGSYVQVPHDLLSNKEVPSRDVIPGMYTAIGLVFEVSYYSPTAYDNIGCVGLVNGPGGCSWCVTNLVNLTDTRVITNPSTMYKEAGII